MSGNGPETTHALTVPAKPTFSLTPNTLDEAMKLADLMSKSDLVPKDYQGKPGNVLIAVQMGAEVGLSPMQAIQSIAVINGRPSLWGDGLLGVVQAHADYEWHEERMSTDTEGVCVVKRKGHEPYTSTFTLEDAKRAGLLSKPGPWQTYTRRMLQLRARAFALRDKFADALKGLSAAEEAIDIEAMMPMAEPSPPAPRPTLAEKLKQQLEADSMPVVAPVPSSVTHTISAEITAPSIAFASSSVDQMPSHQDADLEILKADYVRELDEAKTFKAAAAVRDHVLNNDKLSKQFKDGFKLRFQQKFRQA